MALKMTSQVRITKSPNVTAEYNVAEDDVWLVQNLVPFRSLFACRVACWANQFATYATLQVGRASDAQFYTRRSRTKESEIKASTTPTGETVNHGSFEGIVQLMKPIFKPVSIS